MDWIKMIRALRGVTSLSTTTARAQNRCNNESLRNAELRFGLQTRVGPIANEACHISTSILNIPQNRSFSIGKGGSGEWTGKSGGRTAAGSNKQVGPKIIGGSGQPLHRPRDNPVSHNKRPAKKQQPPPYQPKDGIGSVTGFSSRFEQTTQARFPAGEAGDDVDSNDDESDVDHASGRKHYKPLLPKWATSKREQAHSHEGRHRGGRAGRWGSGGKSSGAPSSDTRRYGKEEQRQFRGDMPRLAGRVSKKSHKVHDGDHVDREMSESLAASALTSKSDSESDFFEDMDTGDINDEMAENSGKIIPYNNFPKEVGFIEDNDDAGMYYDDDTFAELETATLEAAARGDETQVDEQFEEDEEVDDESLLTGIRARHYDPSIPWGEQYNGVSAEEKSNKYTLRMGDTDPEGNAMDQDPEEAYFFRDLTDFSDPFPETPDAIANQIRPLARHGENLDDFLEAVIEHPTKYASVERLNRHPESLRKPYPVKHKERWKVPQIDWISRYRGYLYVTGLDPVVLAEKSHLGAEGADFDDPEYRRRLAERYANFFQLDPRDIYPSNINSAFVGFSSGKMAQRVQEEVQGKRLHHQPIKVATYHLNEKKVDDVNLLGDNVIGVDAEQTKILDGLEMGSEADKDTFGTEAIRMENETSIEKGAHFWGREGVVVESKIDGVDGNVHPVEFSNGDIDVVNFKNKEERDVDQQLKLFVENCEPNTVLQLSSLPPFVKGMVPKERWRTVLHRKLFSAGGEVTDVAEEDIFVVSATTALVRFSSAGKAEVMQKSEIFRSILNKYKPKTKILILPCVRERLHDFEKVGKVRNKLKIKLGPNLVVHGDIPFADSSGEFYLSHMNVLHMKNVPDWATKDKITEFFQPYSFELRDSIGSVQFVTASDGTRTGCAYVGFERQGEAEAALDLFAKRSDEEKRSLLGAEWVELSAMKERKLPVGRKLDARPRRSIDELYDNLKNWERLVDPEHIRELEEYGIKREVLDDVFIKARYQNKSFGAYDQAMYSERLEEDLEVGDRYKEFVQLYVRTLRECMTTPENPGPFAESLFTSDETVDIEMFDGPRKFPKKMMLPIKVVDDKYNGVS